MSTPEFDVGFSHMYSLQHGLTEELLQGSRSIIDLKILSDSERHTYDRAVSSDLIFPYLERPPLLIYTLPVEARDFTSYVRLIKDESNARFAGLVLGRKLISIENVFGGVPFDTILPRFSVVYTDVAANRSGGIDLKLLPPFDGFSEPADKAMTVIAKDIRSIRPKNPRVLQTMTEAVLEGMSYVG